MKSLQSTAMLCAACLLWTGAAALSPPAAVYAAEETQNVFEGLRYEAADGAVTITGFTADLPDSVTIPAEIDGLPVIKIKAGAFRYHNSLTEIILPDSITEIGSGAFENCYVLKNAVLPSNLKKIPPELFWKCEKLETVRIPETVESIGESAFQRCEMLAEINIPAAATEFGENAFAATAWLEAKRAENQFVIVNRVLIDGKKCRGDITIPEGADRIGAGAFSYNQNLVNIVVPAHVTEICRYGCFYLPALKSITILNPECKIYDLDGTISNMYARHKATLLDGVIRGYADSTAQAFTAVRDYPFEVIDGETLLRGDWNGSWLVDVEDAQSVLHAYVTELTGKESQMTDAQRKACDINGDGKTDAADAQYILLYYVYNNLTEALISWDEVLNLE